MHPRHAACFALLLACAALRPVLADGVPVRARTTGAAVRADEHTIVVRPRAGLTDAEKARLHADLGCTLLRRLPLSGIDVVRLPAGLTPENAAEAYSRDPRTEVAEVNVLFTADRHPDDPLYVHQTHHARIRCPEAWDAATGRAEVVVAVVDTGVDLDHPDLAEALWRNPAESENGVDDDANGYVDDLYGWDFIDSDGVPEPVPDYVDNDLANGVDDNVTHGTRVAGCIAAVGNNGEGVAGVAWRATIMPLKVFPDDGSASLADIAEAIFYAVRHGADIVNLSIGGGYNTVLDAAIEEAYANGVLVVAAAGNDGEDLDANPQTPVCNDLGANKVLGVAALDATDRKADFSSYGSAVDLAAPGVELVTTTFLSGLRPFTALYGTGSGTSFSAPLVSGAAALVKSAHPELSGADIRDRLIASADDISGENPGLTGDLGSGRLNVRLAVSDELAERPSSPTCPFPAVGAVGLSGSVDLSWAPSIDPDGGAVVYDVYFGSAEPPPLHASSLHSPSLAVGALERGLAYRWRAVARDGDGYETEGPLWGFVAGEEDAWESDNTPAEASVIAPDGRLRRHRLTAGDLDCTAFAATAGATYELRTYVMTPGAASAGRGKPGASARSASTADTVLTLYAPDGETALAQNDDIAFAEDVASRLLWTCGDSGTYYAEVRAYSDETLGSYDLLIHERDDAVSFPPTKPHSPSPSDRAVGASESLALTWSGGDDPDGGTVAFDVCFGTTPEPPTTAVGLSQRRFEPGALQEGCTYYWRVRARDSGGQIATGPLWVFTVGLSDPYEPDDDPQTAGAILAGAEAQTRAFSSESDVDCARFSALAGSEYVVTTGAPPDPGLAAVAARLEILDSSASAVLAEGDGRAAYTPSEDGVLLLRATPVDRAGYYSLALSGPAPAPASIEVSLATTELQYGDPLTVSAIVRDSLGAPLPGVDLGLRFTGGAAGLGTLLHESDAVGRVDAEVSSLGFALGGAAVEVAPPSVPEIATEARFFTRLTHEIARPGGATGLRIVASPIGGDPAELLGAGPLAGQPLAEYHPADGTYETYTGVNVVIEPGRGYFVKVDQGLAVRAAIGSLPDPFRPYVIPLEAGWNLIGNPYTSRAAWSLDGMAVRRSGAVAGSLREAAAQGLVEPYAWAWDGDADAYELVFDAAVTPGRRGWLEPYEGAFLWASESGLSLVLPAPQSLVPTVSVRAAPPEERSGVLALTLTGAGEARATVYASFGASAPLPARTPPPAPGAARLRAWFDVKGSESACTEMAPGTSATLFVTAGAAGGTVSVRCDDLRALPRSVAPILRDERTGQAYDLRSAGGVTLALSGGETRALTLSVRPDDASLRIRIAETASLPRAVALRAELTRSADVALEVLNAAGRIVRRIELGARAAGLLEANWDGRSDLGSACPSGRYILRLVARAEDGQVARSQAGVVR